MTDTAPRPRQTTFASFPEASTRDERMAAVLVAKDADTGALKAYVTTPPHRQAPDPESIALLKQAVELANL